MQMKKKELNQSLFVDDMFWIEKILWSLLKYIITSNKWVKKFALYKINVQKSVVTTQINFKTIIIESSQLQQKTNT